MSLSDATELWLDAHCDDLVAWRRHIHAHPELGRQEFETPSSSPPIWPTRASTRRCCPVGRD